MVSSCSPRTQPRCKPSQHTLQGSWGLRATRTGISTCSSSTRPSRLSQEPLIAPFTASEALKAIKCMNPNIASGPDGFGPSFYWAPWPTVQQRVMALLHAFDREDADIEHLNRAFMVLLHKKQDSRTPASFCPIYLQNCPMKIITKSSQRSSRSPASST
jgi:hypothetical protein